jgi:hypothetical protein
VHTEVDYFQRVYYLQKEKRKEEGKEKKWEVTKSLVAKYLPWEMLKLSW